ncbi:RagB/SusD family nutrient uptake outer membrane protein [Compostibacter hankyongensis]|uniref:RagB/SusD family nutrient uptake outer membrane protein n=1 Tax=Compostibacter hankyongensis TaxID=1007089 RepID=A0ABP8FJM2_9BACT
MKKSCYIYLVVILLTGTFSCKRDFLELKPLDQYDFDAVWNGSDASLIQTFINNIYLGLPEGFKGDRMLASFVDESMLVFNYSTSSVNLSLISPSAYYGFDGNGNSCGDYVWENAYKNIRACNLFFDNIDNAKSVSAEQKDLLKGEVHFLRAYLYQMLVSMYGGVPIITKSYALNEDYAVARNTYDECIQFITGECDEAAAALPLVAAEKGRATKGAALALKSRVLLYAASDLHNADASWAPGYAHPELVGYVGGNRSARWQAAKDAAKAVMDLGIYALYKAEPQPGDSIPQNYADIFLLKETSEDIFVKFFLKKNGINNIARYDAPNGFHCYGGNTPVGQLVDDYEMKDGSQFSWSDPEKAAHPYENREPRFYASILYDGAYLRPRPVDIQASDPLGVVQTGRFEKWNSTTNKIEIIPGLDTRQSPIEDWNGTYTGYYLMKFMDRAVQGQFDWQENPWRFIRYTEILLNYAEACLGLGQEEEARTYINMIRKRAGLPGVTQSGQALVDRYRHERRIELAYEGHRFFDVRRWMIGEKAYTNVQGIDILYKLNPDKVTTTPTYKVIPSVIERAWKPSFYFLPIKLDEMNKNAKLIQNPLY